MLTPLQQFLIDRKFELLSKEKQARGMAQVAMSAQIQFAETVLIFLASQQKEEDMTKLRLTLDKQATPTDDIQSRQETSELTEALIELSHELDKAWQEEQKRAQKEKRNPKEQKFPLNSLPEGMKPKSVSSKIYGLRTAGRLPINIIPKTRTVTDDKTGETKEVLYMVWAKNPRKATAEKGE